MELGLADNETCFMNDNYGIIFAHGDNNTPLSILRNTSAVEY